MNVKFSIILSYLLLTLFIGLIFRRISGKSIEEFFLAGRKLKNILLFFTLAATNFSAFTIFGFSGAGYRIGFAFYPIMGFGTGFMALSFYIIGEKIMILSRERGYITPADFIFDRYRSKFLKILFASIMILFTLPYISIQAISAGKSLHSLTGLPYFTGAVVITLFVVIYVSTGGMRSIVWTDLIQGTMMIVFTSVAFFLLLKLLGGFSKIGYSLYTKNPELFSRPGGGGAMKPGVWLGYMLLWFFADPMFPHLFQRFMASKTKQDLRMAMILYPIVTTLLFFVTVSIGIMGKYSFPVLEKSKTDAVFSLLIARYLSPVLGTLLFTGSLAALMSTMDSQILTLTSMISLDILNLKKKNVPVDRLITVLIGAFSLAISYNPPTTILNFIRKTTFNGLGVLAPTVIGGIYWKKGNRYGAISSILAGEILVMLYYFGVLKTPGVLPFLIIITVTAVVYILVSVLSYSSDENLEIVFSVSDRFTNVGWALIFAGMLVLANDFWRWGRDKVKLFYGIPGWVWYFIGLGLLLSLLYYFFLKTKK